MNLLRFAFGLLFLTFAAGPAAHGGGDKGKPAEAPKEESVVPYDSKTHGALETRTVSDKTAQWFDVQKDGKRAYTGAPPVLNSMIELAPGSYVVSVNRTERKVTIEAGKKTILLTGELMVEGPKGSTDFYAPFQGKERRLATVEPTVNTATALFAGKYTVRLFGSKARDLGEAEVKAGKRTVLK